MPSVKGNVVQQDLWNLENHEQNCRKKDLTQWASLALKRALTLKKILNRFKSTGILPFNPCAMTNHTRPSESFHKDIEKRKGAQILEEDFLGVAGDVTQYYCLEKDIELHNKKGLT